MRFDQVGLESDRVLILGDRLSELALLGEYHAQIAISRGVVGSDLQGTPVGRGSVVALARLTERTSQIVIRLGIVRPKFQGPAIARNRRFLVRGFL